MYRKELSAKKQGRKTESWKIKFQFILTKTRIRAAFFPIDLDIEVYM